MTKELICPPMMTTLGNGGAGGGGGDAASAFKGMTLATVGGDHEVGSENALAERWRKLLYAESVLQAQRDEILSVLDDGEDGPDAPIGEQIRKVLADQVSRPSPDYRALLLNTRRELLTMKALSDNERLAEDAEPHLKEALRLTDVERHRIPWPGTIQGVAMRAVVDELIDALGHDEHHDDAGIWADETIRDLTDARDNPEVYLARRAASRYSSPR